MVRSMKKKNNFDKSKLDYHWSIKYYEYFFIGGVIFIAIAMFLYNYFYIISSDGLLGFVTASSLFIGLIMGGQGIRSFKEIQKYKDQYVHMGSSRGMDVTIKKRKRR